jgi:hypothetical protein
MASFFGDVPMTGWSAVLGSGWIMYRKAPPRRRASALLLWVNSAPSWHTAAPIMFLLHNIITCCQLHAQLVYLLQPCTPVPYLLAGCLKPIERCAVVPVLVNKVDCTGRPHRKQQWWQGSSM